MFPYGPYSIFPAFCGLLATTFTWISTMDCTFFKIEEAARKKKVLLAFGLWTLQDFKGYPGVDSKTVPKSITRSDYCVTWKHHADLTVNDIDGPLRFARMTSAVACGIACFLLLLLLTTLCCRVSRFGLRMMSLIMVGEGLLTLFSLSAMKTQFCKSNTTCTIDFAGKICCLGCIFWVLTAVATCFLKEPSEVEEEPAKVKQYDVDEEYRRGQHVDEENRRGEPGYDDNRRGEPGYDDNRRGEPGYDDSRRGEPGYDDNRRGEPGVDDNRRGEPDFEDNRRGEPDYEDNRRGEPDYEDNRRGEPDYEDNRRGEPDYEDNRRGEPDYEDNRRGEPDYKDNRRGEHVHDPVEPVKEENQPV